MRLAKFMSRRSVKYANLFPQAFSAGFNNDTIISRGSQGSSRLSAS